jgi:hypothetical protein
MITKRSIINCNGGKNKYEKAMKRWSFNPGQLKSQDFLTLNVIMN